MAEASEPSFLYDAFISYSRRDSSLAERLSRRIRWYRPPSASKAAKRRLTVFRDVERLTASSDLTGALTREVEQARNLVVIASPDAAASIYVDQEVGAFVKKRGPQGAFVALARGEIADALPPSASSLTKSLYVDFRSDSRKAFRLDSLRLIAALFGVDYEDLRREDDLRRNRRRNLLAIAAAVSLFLVFSAYLVWTTPIEVWTRIDQPVVESWSNALAPIQRFLVNRDNPSKVVWLGRNARHARDLDTDFRVWLPPGLPTGFDERVRQGLQPSDGRPAAVLDLRLGRQGESGRLQVKVFTLRDGDDRFLVRLASLWGPDGRRSRLPLREIQGEHPFDLEPDIGRALREQGVPDEDLSGTLVDHTDGGTEIEVHYPFHDFRDDAMEVLDAVASREFEVFSNDGDLQQRLVAELENESGDIVFATLAADEEWLEYLGPSVEGRRLSFPRSPEDNPDELARRVELQGLEQGLARVTVQVMVEQPADFYSLQLIERGDAALATIQPIWDTHEVVRQPAPWHFVRAVPASSWIRAKLPTAPGTAIVDLAVGPEPGTLYATTRGEGLLRSRDSGLSWDFANFGSGDLLRAESVNLLAVDRAIYALAIISQRPGGDVNPLLRLTRRSWLDRWRIGLADMLRVGIAEAPSVERK